MDPIDIRMKNIFVEGDVSYWGEQLHAVGLKETLVKATEAIDYGKPTTASQARRKNRQRLRLHSKTDPLANHFQLPA